MIITIYLTGSIIAYLLFRRGMKNKFGEWTTCDRTYGLFYSLFSWVAVIAVIICFLDCDEKPAKW